LAWITYPYRVVYIRFMGTHRQTILSTHRKFEDRNMSAVSPQATLGLSRLGSKRINDQTRIDENPYREYRFAECHARASELPYARHAADYQRDAVTPE
jgi:hypothetical protein